ncbi:MAG: hypothetical protein GY859_26125, partial [Desulfobacterales bacterium]|nr:hypothetical protein [Desulfobacterales bacterium]
SELPPGPVIAVETAGRVATLSFDPVQGASGYQLYYAPHPGASPAGLLDIGTTTRLSAELNSGDAFYLMVRSYNGNCMGGASNVTSFQID